MNEPEPTIQDMYNRVCDIVNEVQSTAAVYAKEGNRGVTIGSVQDVPQVITVEFHGPVPESYHTDLLQCVNGTGWEFVDEDDVFNGDNTGAGLITVSRDVHPEELARTPTFEKSIEY